MNSSLLNIQFTQEYTETTLFQVVICIFIILPVCWTAWFFFYRPFDLFMDFTEMGFESVTNLKGNNAYKKAMINELRYRRKVGELPPPYPNGWFAILESDTLPLKGVKEVYVLGQNLVVWRGESGKSYVADAYCPHLGANLAVGGKVVGKECIQCPFHTWSFSGPTGRLASVPYSESTQIPLRELAKLKMWESEEKYGFIFIWHHADRLPPSWFLPRLEHIEKWKYRGRSELLVTCHIQEIPENGADISHFKAVHSVPAFRHGMDLEGDWNFLKHIWRADWEANEELGREHEAMATIEHQFSLFNDSFRFFKLTVSAHQVGPGLVLIQFDTPLGPGLLVQSLTPLEPLLQRFIHRLYTPSKVIHPLGLALLYTEAIQISRDIRIWNRKTFLKRPVLLKEDNLIGKYRRWFTQFYSEGSYNEAGSGLSQVYLGNSSSNFNKCNSKAEQLF